MKTQGKDFETYFDTKRKRKSLFLQSRVKFLSYMYLRVKKIFFFIKSENETFKLQICFQTDKSDSASRNNSTDELQSLQSLQSHGKLTIKLQLSYS